MGSLFRSLAVQFREFYKNLTPTKRMSMMVATVIVVLAAMVVAVMLSGTDYAVVLDGVPADQTAIVMERLQSKNIPFKVIDGGKTFTVPKELVHSTRMALMTEMGSGKIGNMGFELFDKQDFGATSFAQRVNYQRALQGELIRAISTLDAVKRAKVILALPPKKTFLEDGGTPKASVVVELNAGKSLSDEQVRGITYLVANSVEGMDADNVNVVDSRGKLLSKQHDAASAGNAQLMELKTKREREIEEKVEAVLARVVGQGKVIVRADATLSPRQIHTTEEQVDPDKTATLSQQTEEEALDGSRANPTGVPGARANLPGAADAGQVSFNQNIKKGLNTTNYKVPTTVRQIKESAGTLERLTISVLVDGSLKLEKNDKGEEAEVYVPRSQEEISKYETLVKGAIGFSEQRGDSIKVENMRFTREDFSESEKLLTTLERKKLLTTMMKWMLLGFGLTLFFFIVIRPFMRWITDSFQDSVEDMLPRTIEELEELQSVDSTLPGMSNALPVLEESLDPDKAESELLRERIMNLMETDEEKSAGAFSLWLVRRDG